MEDPHTASQILCLVLVSILCLEVYKCTPSVVYTAALMVGRSVQVYCGPAQ